MPSDIFSGADGGTDAEEVPEQCRDAGDVSGLQTEEDGRGPGFGRGGNSAVDLAFEEPGQFARNKKEDNQSGKFLR